jgi:hypothetical protein
MSPLRLSLPAAFVSFVALLMLSCGSALNEGQYAGECNDGIDNDGDGLLDCQDTTCQGSPLCQGDDDDGDDDDTSAGDDDDTSGSDDDDSDPTMVTIGGDIEAGILDNGVTANSVVSEVGNPANSITTGPHGLWELSLPREPLVVLNAIVQDHLEGRLYLNLSGPTQDSRDDQHLTVLRADELLLFEQFLSIPHDPTRAQLFVWADSQTQGTAIGAWASIDSLNDGSFKLAGTEPIPTNELNDTTPLLFLNVEPGDVTITVIMANGTSCDGPSLIPLEAAMISTAYFACP